MKIMSELHKFFLSLWQEREEGKDGETYITCFETKVRLSTDKYKENSACYSHILPKSLYPEYEYKRWNIRIVSPEAHHQYTIYPEKAPKQYGYYKILLDLHKKGELV